MTHDPTPDDPVPSAVTNHVRHRLERDARRHGHAVVVLSLADCRDKADLLRRASAAFSFPDWFGHNWDALADSLMDLSWLDAPGYLVILEAAEAIRTSAPAVWQTLCEVLEEVRRDRASVGIAWRVVLAPAPSPA